MASSGINRARRARALLPAFFAVGPPRTGTTWLYEVLKGRVNLPKYTKELRFFDTNYSKGMRWYSAQFDPVDPTLPVGELCATYFCSAEARKRISAFAPDAKIICTFRDPVDRLFSLYRAKRAGGLISSYSFGEALSHDRELLESSKYAFHLSKWHSAFGKANVIVALHDDLVRDPQGYLDGILNFSGIPHFQLDAKQLRLVNSYRDFNAPWSFRLTHFAATIAQWLRMHKCGSLVAAVKKSALRRILLGGGGQIVPLDPVTVQSLRELLCPEIEQLEMMTGRDLSAWKSDARWSNSRI